MRSHEFELNEDELFELKMSPTSLANMAKGTDARVGMEFELIVPGVSEDEEFESEPDYDMDESFPTGRGWERDVVNFFTHGQNSNGRRVVERAIGELEGEYSGWLSRQMDEYVRSPAGEARAIEIADENVDADDYESDKERQQAVRDYLDDNYDDIVEQIREEFVESADNFESYIEAHVGSMMEFAQQYGLDWPYWTEPAESDYERSDISDIAKDFGRAIGRPVDASSSYHGATRRPGHYVVEPDSSLEGDQGEMGLEFVSPPLPVDEMLQDLDRVVDWASTVGAYTNSTTGLHINVSVPNQANLDYVKLAMFLGDDYVLEQFGRWGNSYCRSSLQKIVSQAKESPDRVQEMMRQLQRGLNQLASKIVHTGSTDKFTSINNRGEWIEFRGPGGDWLANEAGLKAVRDTLLRTVVALDVATKPEAYKQEYYKKLYKTLSQGSEDDTIQYFARYAAGELPTSALKSFVRNIQQKRQATKEPFRMPDKDPQNANWEIYDVYNGQSIYPFVANSREQAIHAFNYWLTSGPQRSSGDRFSIRGVSQPVPGSTQDRINQRTAAQADQQQTSSLPPGNMRWRILDWEDREVHSFVHRADQGSANQYARDWLAANVFTGHGMYSVVPAT